MRNGLSSCFGIGRAIGLGAIGLISALSLSTATALAQPEAPEVRWNGLVFYMQASNSEIAQDLTLKYLNPDAKGYPKTFRLIDSRNPLKAGERCKYGETKKIVNCTIPWSKIKQESYNDILRLILSRKGDALKVEGAPGPGYATYISDGTSGDWHDGGFNIPPGNDRLTGGPGDEVFHSDSKDADVIDGGGHGKTGDTMIYENTSNEAYWVNLNSVSGDNGRGCAKPATCEKDTLRNIENLVIEEYPGVRFSSDSSDTLIGSGANNVLSDQNGGSDVMIGCGGNDYIEGGSGSDDINGDGGLACTGTGNDWIWGGPGSDVLRSKDGLKDVVECDSGDVLTTAWGPTYDPIDNLVGNGCRR